MSHNYYNVNQSIYLFSQCLQNKKLNKSTVTGYEKSKCSSTLVAQSTEICKYNYKAD